MTPEMLVPLLAVLTCAYIDARTGFIPNHITYPTLCLTLLAAAALHRFPCAVFGALCVGGVLVSLYVITRKRGLGLGDVKLGACIGAGLGPAYGLAALGTSFIAGGMLGAYLLLSGRAGRKTALRFGPFLAAGYLFALAAHTLVPQWLS